MRLRRHRPSLPPPRFHAARRFAGFVLGYALATLGFAASPDVSTEPFRLGFSRTMFSGVNENDARAAVKVWGQVVAREHHIPTSPDAAVYHNRPSLGRALQDRQVDAVGITLPEYQSLRETVSFNPVYATYSAGSVTERYALLVRREGPVKTLADLHNRSLIFHDNPRESLAPLWLDVTLVQQGHPPAARLARSITQHARLPQVVLPVFFGQADACVVSHKGFETMAELNPQLARQMTVLAKSPPLIPAVFAFRSDYAPSYKPDLLAGVRELSLTPAGQQVLTIFHGDNIEAQSPAALEPSLELVATHHRLCTESHEPASTTTPRIAPPNP